MLVMSCPLITLLTVCIVDTCTDLMAVLSRVCIAVERTCQAAILFNFSACSSSRFKGIMIKLARFDSSWMMDRAPGGCLEDNKSCFDDENLVSVAQQILNCLNLIVLRLKAKEFIHPVLYRCRLLEYVAIASEIFKSIGSRLTTRIWLKDCDFDAPRSFG